MSDDNLLKEREQLNEGLTLVVEALDKLEDGLMSYETKNRKYPTIPTCGDEAMECPSWLYLTHYVILKSTRNFKKRKER